MKFVELARDLVKNALRVKENEIVEVTLTGERSYFDFLDEFTIEISKIGAFPTIRLHTPSYRKRFLMEVPEKFLRRTPPQTLKWIKDVTRHVNILAEIPDTNFNDVPPRKTRIAIEARRPIIDQIKHMSMSKIYLPTPELAKYFKVKEDVFIKSITAGLDIDYENLRKRVKKVTDLLKENRSEIRLLTGGGEYELKFKINGRLIHFEDGTHELPAGSVFVAPVETSVNGSILLDGVIYQGKPIKNLVLKFREGRMIDSSAQSNHSVFLQRLKTSYGDKEVFGGFGIGLNDGIEEPIGCEFVDSRVLGSVHILIGSNIIYGGENFSDLSWILMNTEPTVFVDSMRLLDKSIFCAKAST